MKSSITVRFKVYVPNPEWNSSTHLNRATRIVFFTRITVQTAAQRELARADAFTRWLDGHANTKQCCEIQCLNSVMNTNYSVIHTSLKPNRRNTVQRDSQKAFQSTRRHNLPWIYCSNIHCTMFLWQKFGILKLNFITEVMVYNYCTYLWLGYSMCAFIPNVFRLQFFIQIDYLKVISIYIYIYIYIVIIILPISPSPRFEQKHELHTFWNVAWC